MSVDRYPWPASAISPQDMALLHHVRETTATRLPITELIARAVRQVDAEACGPESSYTHLQGLGASGRIGIATGSGRWTT
jgi:hypothetical protein